MDGIVIDIRVFSRREKDESTKQQEKKKIEKLRRESKKERERVAEALEHSAVQGVDLKRGMKAVGLDPGFYLFRGRGREEVLPWDIVDNGVSKAYYLRELDKSVKEQPTAHCPEIQGCIKCGVCVEVQSVSFPSGP